MLEIMLSIACFCDDIFTKIVKHSSVWQVKNEKMLLQSEALKKFLACGEKCLNKFWLYRI